MMVKDLTPSINIAVVICTFNRAPHLDAVLAVLSGQTRSDEVVWDVLVVDNASTDDTADVVAAHQAKALLPGLRYVYEAEQGLTAARLRGVTETTAPWVAFVDDDNMLAPGWLQAVGQAIRAHPEAGGVGGKVILDWEAPPPGYLKQFGFCFAQQDAGEEDCVTDNLAGAGMVLRRSALIECGWVDGPLVADRVGKSLVSGGDAEIAQRIRSAGYPLWYTPAAVLNHRIPASRTERRYLFRISHALGTSAVLIDLLTWPGDWTSWRKVAASRRRYWRALALRGLWYGLCNRGHLTPALAWCSHALGVARGVRHCLSLKPERRSALFGAAPIARS